eukprot:NODE_4303_length_809_cov_69.219941_g4145_i0.p1 GENE.NODE_4303_length_809_cov_69.219941_g4145_i0~~NODE_4303_length_809_cov_69.219941_g4145_i0.p1  ORF type:complete len:243 (-),score=47.36 NODE_4303_length_809_cov_69.219941_g4145_i0:29-757(-)
MVKQLNALSRLRGNSFVQEYTHPQPTIERSPTMLKNPYTALIPTSPSHKHTVVLDLDETLIYAREGPLEARPYTTHLLDFLGQHCEVVVWTAAQREYAKAVMRHIDPNKVIQHCIYRHQSWFRSHDCTKDLQLIGRDMNYVLIIENTPDCVRANPHNGIILPDYRGGAQDRLLPTLRALVGRLFRSAGTVPDFLSNCPQLELKSVQGELGELPLYHLKTIAPRRRRRLTHYTHKKRRRTAPP